MISKKNKKILERLNVIERAFKEREREKWSSAERFEIACRGEKPADFYQVWDKLVRLWAMKDWLKKYADFPRSHMNKIKEWEKELKYFL